MTRHLMIDLNRNSSKDKMIKVTDCSGDIAEIIKGLELTIRTVKTKIAKEAINKFLIYPVSSTTYSKHIKRIDLLIESTDYPSKFVPCGMLGHNFVLDIRMVLALFVYMKKLDELKATPSRNADKWVDRITEADYQQHLLPNLYGLVSALTGEFHEGQMFYRGSVIHALAMSAGAKCSENTFYAWSQMHPDLPKYSARGLYTHDQVKQWIDFLTNKPGRQYLKIGKFV